MPTNSPHGAGLFEQYVMVYEMGQKQRYRSNAIFYRSNIKILRSNANFYRSNGKKYRSNAKFYRSNGKISVRTVKIDVFHFYRPNGKIGSSFQPIKIQLTYHPLE